MDDDVERAGYLSPNRFRHEVVAGHHHEGFDAGKGIARSVGVDRRHGTVMPRVHRLQHVEGFGAPDLADDQTVRPHTERRDDEIAERYLRRPIAANRVGLQPRDVSLRDRKSTRLNSSHLVISYAVFCLKKKKADIHRVPAVLLMSDRSCCTSTHVSIMYDLNSFPPSGNSKPGSISPISSVP